MDNQLPEPAGNGRDEPVIAIGAERTEPPATVRVDGMVTRIKKITTTDEGKLQVVLETEGMDDNAITQAKGMLSLQQTCFVNVSMAPVQRDLFDA